MSDVSALNLQPGDLIGGYTLIARLGAGAMGSVWRVQDDGGQEYAMKILRDSLTDDTVPNAAQSASPVGGTQADPIRNHTDPDVRERMTARERLRREAMALKKINHPGVCGIVDMELDDSVAFIVTELIEGKNLRDDVRINGRYAGDDLERLARKLIAAVKAVHAAGIVHRDIKPTNVMVSASGPVLVDFGIAMTGGESHVTRTGLVMGTPGFIAPEIIDGAESDAMTDWWSTASVLAFAATGAPVFGTKPMMAVLERAAAGNANLTGLPAGTMAAFRAALNPDRTKRCTPDELLHAIAIDALNPRSWEDAATDANTDATNTDGTGVVRPFERAAADNPRLLWRDEPADPSRDQSHGTSAMPAEKTTTAVPSPVPHATVPLPGGVTPSAVEQTMMLPPERTAILQPVAQQPEQTAVLQPALPAAQQPATDEAAPTTAIAGTPLESAPISPIPPLPAAVEPTPGTIPPFLREMAAGQPTPPPPVIARQQPFPNQPAATSSDASYAAYHAGGTLPLYLLTIPTAILAASMPVMAIIVATILLWMLLTIGYSTTSQLAREARQGGVRKRFDGIKRMASLPWHLAKAFVTTVPRTLAIIVVMTALSALAMVTLSLPVMHVNVHIFHWLIAIPLFDETPLSSSGMTLGAGMAIGWLLCAFSPHSAPLRIGAGVIRGNDRHHTVPAIIWGAYTAVALASLVITAPIEWWPLVNSLSSLVF